jgi:hypothetical protein
VLAFTVGCGGVQSKLMKMSSDLRGARAGAQEGGDQRAGRGEGDWAHYMSPAQVLTHTH